MEIDGIVHQSHVHRQVLRSEGLCPQDQKPDPAIRNLALGILLQAFRDIVSPKKSNKQWENWKEDAIDWFYSAEIQPGSFNWVCDTLDLNAADLREWLKEYRKAPEEERKKLAGKLSHFQIRH